ncbi:hypothetical protein [Flavihumibacter petaseus]|nr:hypothetical protein [Flavihumibacter petaseus]
MLKTFLLVLLAYIAYRFIFGFVVPVTKATRNVRRQFKAAQEQMEEQMRAQQGYQPGETQVNANGSANQQGSAREIKKDYIDFEEIRD